MNGIHAMKRSRFNAPGAKRIIGRIKLKRQHPDNPDLFWCSICKKYRLRIDYSLSRKNIHGIAQNCKECLNANQAKYRIKKTDRISSRIYPNNHDLFYCSNCQKYKSRSEYYKQKLGKYGVDGYCRECRKILVTNEIKYKSRKKRYKENPEYFKSISKSQNDSLSDSFIKTRLRFFGINITPETIELKRQQIIMKRTMRELRKWRKENDPTITDVPGIESENETVDECA